MIMIQRRIITIINMILIIMVKMKTRIKTKY